MKRIYSNIEQLINKINSSEDELVILSTYFTSKIDPMRKFQQPNDNFEYFKDWYESINELGLRAVIFCDTISESFERKYTTDKISFIRCQLGPHSLNDERFFIFHEFIQDLSPHTFIVSTDINDVIVNKNPLELLASSPEKLFVGRGQRKVWKNGKWALKALFSFNRKYNKSLPVSFFNYPLLTPGTLGGKKEVMQKIYQEMKDLFSELGDDGNYDMQVFNFIMKEKYFPKNSFWDGTIPFWIANWYYYALYRVSRKIEKGYMAHKYDLVTPEEGIVSNELIYAGFPFVSMVGKYEKKGVSEAYLIHK
ncbi:hypothetical protein SAMN06295967_105237 [Belliella buryatensis]|uniref:Uncharacterized protein n=1 Tax=Belliella buryatensis TaxID=1500549 RepID=A0A239CUF2_9BACT|nr:hypothetical protein [Belliella buryatensis]SNS23740.1 hypothetical protein SAMN06295967_105237 [Belliella buryatensis]